MPEHYIGLMSGTSMDGIDAVLASFDDASVELHGTLSLPYPARLRAELLEAVADPDGCTIDRIGMLDRWVGECFRDAATTLLAQCNVEPNQVRGIGSHGQTLRHQPDAPKPWSLQVGDAATIASGTGIVTVADFRRADIAAGGQGAPLVPPFHDWLFGQAGKRRVILNIGGIANVTILGGEGRPVTGFDTGPGNALLDRWMQRHQGETFDRDGTWAASGRVDDALLEFMLSFAYFGRQPPKSTGLEEFNLSWLARYGAERAAPEDVQATLCELTARTIAADIARYAPGTEEVFVCGGGAHNRELLRRLSARLPAATIADTSVAGLHPDWVEATAFAWLAMRTLNGQSGNLPSVTGATRKVVLGAIHSP